jgi:DNA-binding LacI/PurR family transcriptional regulator
MLRGPNLSEGRRLARLMLDEIDPPTGLFAHNDLMA